MRATEVAGCGLCRRKRTAKLNSNGEGEGNGNGTIGTIKMRVREYGNYHMKVQLKQS